MSEIKLKSVMDRTCGLTHTIEFDPFPSEVDINADPAVMIHA